MRLLCFIILVMVLNTSAVSGQQVVYANAANLVLRDRPEKMYNVFAVLQRGCPLLVEPYEAGYRNDKNVTRSFYQVGFRYIDDRGIHNYIGGWVLKKYVVFSRAQVKGILPGRGNTDSTSVLGLFTNTGHVPEIGFNMATYPPPEYVGGEKPPAPVRRIYKTGPRGGCYYIGPSGHKVYVDKKFCNDKKQ